MIQGGRCTQYGFYRKKACVYYAPPAPVLRIPEKKSQETFQGVLSGRIGKKEKTDLRKPYPRFGGFEKEACNKRDFAEFLGEYGLPCDPGRRFLLSAPEVFRPLGYVLLVAAKKKTTSTTRANSRIAPKHVEGREELVSFREATAWKERPGKLVGPSGTRAHF